jgi:ketosteroid isomerase-like protein
MSNADVIRELTGKWNSGDADSVSELYTEDAEIRTGPHWPEQAVYRGIDGSMEIFIVFTFRDGKIAAHEWFDDHDTAIAAVRGD